MASRFFATKSIDKLIHDSEHGAHVLKKALGPFDLIAIGIGCIIGTGIFVLTGEVAISNAGPGIILSFVFCGLACIFSALCYAEFASLIPIAGSAYTFSYASMGELLAWIIGWDLLLEYGVATAAVANGWSSHFVNFLKLLHDQYGLTFMPLIPERWALTPMETLSNNSILHGIMNVPATLAVLLITCLLIVGIKESARVNNIIVTIKVGVSIFFIAVGFFFINPANWHPIVPKFVPAQVQNVTSDGINTPITLHNLWKLKHLELWKIVMLKMGHPVTEGFGGWAGIFMAAAIIFFAYIGFDAVSTTSEEAKNPGRDLPIGIVGSLLICTVLYILMAAIFTGIVRCDGTLSLNSLGVDKGAPMVYAFKQVHSPWVNKYAALLVDIGALCGITSVLLVLALGQSRILFAMARDGLLPSWISKVHPKFQTPFIGSLIGGSIVAVIGGFVQLRDIAEMANIGTLFAFVLVAAGILFIRKYQPERRAAFRTPLVPLIPILAIVFCVALMCSLPLLTWFRFVAWLLIGLVVYFAFGYWNSALQNELKSKD